MANHDCIGCDNECDCSMDELTCFGCVDCNDELEFDDEFDESEGDDYDDSFYARDNWGK